jgi:hypothetical protein
MLVPANEIKVQWNEPYFFAFRTMGRRGLLLRVLCFLALVVVFSIVLVNEPRSRGVAEVAVLALLASAVITVLLAAPSIRRRIVVSRDGISWSNLYPASLLMFFLSAGAVSRLELKRVVLQGPKDHGNRFPFGVMVVELKYANPALIAVPNHVALERLARILNDIGVAATLPASSTSGASGSTVAGEPT